MLVLRESKHEHKPLSWIIIVFFQEWATFDENATTREKKINHPNMAHFTPK